MKIMTRIVLGLVLVFAFLAAGILSSFYFDAARPEHPVGFQEVALRNPDGRLLSASIWYPTDSKPALKFSSAGRPQIVATGGRVVGQQLPLIVISHGGGAPRESHADTALALASAGFVVAAIGHTEDETMDTHYVTMPHWLADRPREIHLMLQYMLNDWTAHRQLDATRVGMFGFSNGGYTALVSIGGVPNSAKIAAHWKQPLSPTGAIPDSVWVHDPIVKAAVIVAPASDYLFEPDGLSHVTVPVQLWSGSLDRVEPYATRVAVARRLLPKPPEFHSVAGAGHMTFLAPCPTVMRPLFFCSDANGFDRNAFHRDFNRSVIAFFRRNL
jgi:predicted dienelactone hydrolase